MLLVSKFALRIKGLGRERGRMKRGGGRDVSAARGWGNFRVSEMWNFEFY